MTSEKSYDNASRLDALVARVAALEAAPAGPTVTIGNWNDTSAMSNGWGKGAGWFKYQHWTINGTNWLYLSAKLLTPGTVADGTQIVTTALASFYQPATAVRFPVWTYDVKGGPGTPTAGPAEMAGFELQADGTIHTFGVFVNSSRVDCNVLIPLDL